MAEKMLYSTIKKHKIGPFKKRRDECKHFVLVFACSLTLQNYEKPGQCFTSFGSKLTDSAGASE
jgi:hypothetical protein